MTSTAIPPADRFAKRFLVINLIAFPLAGVVARFAPQWLISAGVPLWLPLVVPAVIGSVLVISNIVLTRFSWRLSGWNATTVAMAVWSIACIAALALLGSYSPLNLLLAGLTGSAM